MLLHCCKFYKVKYSCTGLLALLATCENPVAIFYSQSQCTVMDWAELHCLVYVCTYCTVLYFIELLCKYFISNCVSYNSALYFALHCTVLCLQRFCSALATLRARLSFSGVRGSAAVRHFLQQFGRKTTKFTALDKGNKINSPRQKSDT